MSARYNRRRFVSTVGRSCAGLIILSNSNSVLGYEENEKLGLAMIGAGGRGAANLNHVKNEKIVALCDVDQRRAADSFSKNPQVAKFADYRRMLDEVGNQIDAVVVSTPNHVHAPASVTAMRMGKHCYCEKPLTHSVHEVRVAVQVARQQRVATQMGTQIHATDNYRRIVELIRGGAIGAVRECHCWLRGGGSAGDRPSETPPVPAGLDWDLWLGPAPKRPYHPCYVPHDWHYWWDFGGGAFGNMGCHYFDLAFWALDLKHPVSIEADSGAAHPESTPAKLHVQYKFPARGDLPPATLTWTHGPEPPPIFAKNEFPDWAWGVFVGDKGMLLASYPKHMLWPQAAFQDFETPEPSIPSSPGHHQEWINACKSGGETSCNFEYAGAITEAVLLGNISHRVGRKLIWDSQRMKIVNDANANAYLRREYRSGWTL